MPGRGPRRHRRPGGGGCGGAEHLRLHRIRQERGHRQHFGAGGAEKPGEAEKAAGGGLSGSALSRRYPGRAARGGRPVGHRQLHRCGVRRGAAHGGGEAGGVRRHPPHL